MGPSIKKHKKQDEGQSQGHAYIDQKAQREVVVYAYADKYQPDDNGEHNSHRYGQ